MELKDFVKGVITDITCAVKELQDELKNGAVVSPNLERSTGKDTVKDYCNAGACRPISEIDFEVAVTAGNMVNKEAGGALGIHVLQGKVGGKSEERMESISKIRFSIPLILPMHNVISSDSRETYNWSNRKALGVRYVSE